MLVLTRNNQLVKPKRLRDLKWTHPATRGLVAAVPLDEAGGAPRELVRNRLSAGSPIWSGSPYGASFLTADGSSSAFSSLGDIPSYDTTANFTVACLLNVNAWSTTTSGDFFWGKNSFANRGWTLLNNGGFGPEIGFRVDKSGGSNYAAVTRAAVGTGLMLFVGRMTNTFDLELVTVTQAGLTQHIYITTSGMDDPAGADLTFGTTNGNGSVQVLGCWMWNYVVPDVLLREVFAAPWSMFQEDRKRTSVLVRRPVTKSFTSLVEARGGIQQSFTSLVEARGIQGFEKIMPVYARGWVNRSISTPVEATGTVAKSFTSLVESKGGVGQSFSSLVEAKGFQFYQSWPITLPIRPLVDGFQETLPQTGERTTIDHMPMFQVQRTKAGTWPISATYEVTSAQWDILLAFYEDTLGSGTLPFEWPHPISQTTVLARFRGGEVPSAVAVGWNTYHATISIEVMP